MASTSINRVFRDSEFWFKLGVDYDDIVPSSGLGEDGGDESIDTLLDEFIKRKRHVVCDEFGTIDEFKEKIKSPEDSHSDLFRIYTRYLWSQKKDGEEFQPQEISVEDSIQQVFADRDVILEEGGADYSVLWPAEDILQVQIDENDNTAVGRKFLRARPVVIKKEEDRFEVRGRARDKKSILTDIRAEPSIEEVEATPVSESIANHIEQLLTEENGYFKVIGIDFAESELPANPQLELKSDSKIYDDVQQLRQFGVISLEGMSEVRKLKLQDKQTGRNFKINVVHADQGFEFKLIANRRTDSERQRLKENFEETTDIEFGKQYDYSSQADERFIVNRILAESAETYKKYFEQLGENASDLIEDLIDTEEITTRSCRSCGAELESDEDECEECGERDFFETSDRLDVDVDEREAFRKLFGVLDDCSPSDDRFSILEWSIEKSSFGSGESERKVGLASFQCSDVEGREAAVSYGEVYFISMGNQRKPQRLDDYMLNAALMTFGDSRNRTYRGFGSFSLYDLLLDDEVEVDSLVGEATYDALVGVPERVMGKSRETRSQGRRLLERMDSVGSLSDNEEELKKIYWRNTFEKAVFYLMKEMFPYSERLGKEGKKEPDSLLILPLSDGGYYVATGDAKISYSNSGYDLSSREADKAARYILSALGNDRIQNRTGDTGIEAHIFMSQNFRESQFDTVAENIRENLEASDRNDVDDVNVVFMEFKALIDLFELYERYYTQMSEPEIRQRFHEFVAEELGLGDEYVHFNSESVADIREKLINRVDDLPDSQISTYSG